MMAPSPTQNVEEPEREICKLGYSPRKVRKIARRFRDNSVWRADGVEMPQNEIEFGLLVGIGEGRFVRRMDEQIGEWRYWLVKQFDD